jgi:hypothetical protein
MLELMLSPFNLGYHVRDGIMIITTKEKLDATLETRVYDCRDILAANTGKYRSYIAEFVPTNPPKNDSSKTGMPMGGPPMGPPAGSPGTGPAVGGPTVSVGIGGGGASQATTDHSLTPVNDLIDVIKMTVSPQTWSDQGGPGTICEYDGLLIVSTTSEVQSQFADLLDKLQTKLPSRSPK